MIPKITHTQTKLIDKKVEAMSNENWNEICFLLSENIKKDIDETSFEQNVIQALRVLGWKQYSGDLEIRPSYQIGAANRIAPDFVIKSADNHKLFVIEIKQPNIPFTSTFQQQLFSYMRQLKLEYGLLIGQGIQLFYDGDLSNQDDPILLETIRFEKESEKGNAFVKLFSKDHFNKTLLKEYTISALEKINRKEEHKKLKSKILSEDYKFKINELVKQDFIGEYDGELIDSVLSELKIEINDRGFSVLNSGEREVQYNQLCRNIKIDKIGDARRYDNTKYIFNGNIYGKGRLVLAVIKFYAKNNPGTSYNQLKRVFPDSLQGGETFTTISIAQSKKDRRNFTKPVELIELTDQVIAVSTEWGISNIKRFLENCNRLNIKIEIAKE